MRRSAPLAGLALSLSCTHATTSPAPPRGPCNYSSGLTVAADETITASCVVAGDLLVEGHAHLLIDYTASPGATFTVQGNIVTQDSATLEARGSAAASGTAFIVANQFTQQLSIKSLGHSTFKLDSIELRTRAPNSAADGSLTMAPFAYDDAQMVVDGARLDVLTSWLLGNFFDRSQLQAQNSLQVPTETYVHDSSQVVFRGPNTQGGVWFESPLTGTVNLPSQTGPYSWQMGKSAGFSVGWQLTIDTASLGLGLQSLPGSQLTIIGRGTASYGELKIGYFVAGGQDTLRHLAVGIQNGTMGNGRLTFQNVNLGPIAWQVYASAGETLLIDSSVVNEIGISGSAAVTVDNSVLQFAVLGAIAPGSTLNISNSEIWNQLIEADNDAVIQITDSRVVGSLFDALATASRIEIVGGEFADNGSCTTIMVNVATGEPSCNPFRPAGPPTKTGPGTVTCSATTGCTF